MQKKFVALCLLAASVSVMSVRAMDDENEPLTKEDVKRIVTKVVNNSQINDLPLNGHPTESGTRSVTLPTVLAEFGLRLNALEADNNQPSSSRSSVASLNATTPLTHRNKDNTADVITTIQNFIRSEAREEAGNRIRELCQLSSSAGSAGLQLKPTANDIELVAAGGPSQKAISVREGFDYYRRCVEHCENKVQFLENKDKISLSLSEKIWGAATGLLAAQWVLASQKMGLLTSVVKPLGGVLYNTGMTVSGVKSVLPAVSTKVGGWFSSAAAYELGGYSMSGAKAFVGSHAGCLLVTTLIVKTVFDVAKGMRVKNQENNTKTAFECYLDGLKQARKDAINLDPNIGDKEAAKRHVDDKMKQGRAIVATGMRFFGNRFVQNVKLPGKVVIGLSDYMRKAIIS